tara:strand:- start:387 stop:1427 length:1041 start_codon:yes stop_codon:yes gene_type:complete
MGKSSKPRIATSTSDISEDFQPTRDENIAIANTIANMPFVPFAGGDPRAAIANFSNDQLSAFDQVRGMGNRVDPLQNAAIRTTTAGVQGIADPSAMMANYENPYVQNVIDNTVADLEIDRQRLNEQSRMQSPFGGTRQAIVEAMNNRNFAKAASDVRARQRARAFDQAAGLSQNAMSQMLGAGAQFGNLANMAQQLGLTQASAQSGIGQQIQAQDQAYKDYLQKQFFDMINHPLRQLSIRLGALGQTPLGTVQRTPIIQPSSLGSTLGGLGSLMSGAAALGLCWVAREVYGPENLKWVYFRQWLLESAPDWFYKLYVKYGEKFAEFISDKPMLKKAIRKMMDKVIG